MARTGRPKSPTKMVRRTVRNHPDVDAVLVRMAAEHRKAVPAVMREACESLAGRFKEEGDMANPPKPTLCVELDPIEVAIKQDPPRISVLDRLKGRFYGRDGSEVGRGRLTDYTASQEAKQ